MERIDTDICVIGAGSGGLSVAAGAVQMGARVVLIEGHKMGGDCLNYGCVPSKALLAAARDGMDYAEAKDRVAKVIDTIAPVDSQERFEGLGCTVIRDFARFTGPREVAAGGRIIRARRFVVATGSRPFVPPIKGLDKVPFHTNETIFDLRDRPDHLIIIGGGPIGMEMAQAHIGFGSKVTVIEAATVLGRDDPEAARVVLDHLRKQGVEILEQTSATEVTAQDGVTVQTTKGAVSGSHLLVAVGRKPNIERLDLGLAGVQTTPKGIAVGADLRARGNRRIYAIGDVLGGLHFTHLAGYHAGVIVRSMLLGLPSKARALHIPRATYTDPELAQVGLTEAEARAAHGDRLEVARYDIRHNDRAIATGRTRGLIKVMVVKGRPVGATIVGADAGEHIGIWAMAIANGLKMTAIANTVLPYPTMGEINKRAAGAYFSPRLFDSPMVKRVVRAVQKWLP